jgi:hypothetical protein
VVSQAPFDSIVVFQSVQNRIGYGDGAFYEWDAGNFFTTESSLLLIYTAHIFGLDPRHKTEKRKD